MKIREEVQKIRSRTFSHRENGQYVIVDMDNKEVLGRGNKLKNAWANALYALKNNPQTIKIITRVHKSNLSFCRYVPELDEAINNFRSVGTVKVIHGVCYIQKISLAYFIEIVQRRKVKLEVITTLI